LFSFALLHKTKYSFTVAAPSKLISFIPACFNRFVKTAVLIVLILSEGLPGESSKTTSRLETAAEPNTKTLASSPVTINAEASRSAFLYFGILDSLASKRGMESI
jgi:hypothetical protein